MEERHTFQGQRWQKQARTVPDAWNQLEAGILFAVGIPLLVFREPGISGGVFDNGGTDLFVHSMPKPDLEYTEMKTLRAVFQKWTSKVRAH